MGWESIRNWIGTVGVALLVAQLVKLFGILAELLGPIAEVMAIIGDFFPWLANLLAISFGWDINGMDIMATGVALSATFIVISAISTSAPMKTIYVFRFLLIPYAFIVIGLAIFIQVLTPFVELNGFHSGCRDAGVGELYGSGCADSARQLRYLDTFFGSGSMDDLTESESNAGIGLLLSIMWIVFALPLLAVIIFFFKRLRVNKLLKRVVISVVSAAAIIIGSTAYEVYTTDITVDEAIEQMFT